MCWKMKIVRIFSLATNNTIHIVNLLRNGLGNPQSSENSHSAEAAYSRARREATRVQVVKLATNLHHEATPTSP